MDRTTLVVFLCLWGSGIWAEHTANPYGIRLIGGGSRCSGTVEMKQRGEWKLAYSDYWTLEFAGEVCKQLDCGAVISTRRRATSVGEVWGQNPDCHETDLKKCFDKITFSSYSTEATCSDSVRLVHGANLCSGRLEVNTNQSWSSVCENDFDMPDAEVVCRELGCGAPSDLYGALFGKTDAPTWGKEFQCKGNESALWDCESSWQTRKTCAAGNIVELTCSDPDDVRLVGGARRCAGKLQVKYDGGWKNVMKINLEWSMKASEAICRWLDCGSSILTRITNDAAQPTRLIGSSCIERKSAMKDCVTTTDTFSSSSMEITCSDSVRLLSRTQLCSGRPEVKANQSWSPMCMDDFDRPVAEVICREFGCGPHVSVSQVLSKQNASVLSQKFDCEGNESALMDCNSTSKSTCTSGTVTDLSCLDKIRLVGEPSRCAGTLDLFNQGEWRPVADCDFNWDQNSAETVCRQLGCGPVVSTSMTEEPTARPVWCIRTSCVESSSALGDCVDADDDLEMEYSLEIICSDLLEQPHVSLYSSTNEVSEAKTQVYRVLIGSTFGIMCSIKPQYQGGSFQLVFSTSSATKNYSMPAVNHSALFLFTTAHLGHQGIYSCVYHVYVFDHYFSPKSEPLHLSVLASLTDLIIRLVVLLGVLASVPFICFYYQVSRKQKLGREKPAETE